MKSHRPNVPGTSRRAARERAVGLLYEAYCKSISPSEVLGSLVVEPDAFAASLVLAVEQRQGDIDALVAGRSRGWSLDRMPVIDLILLRLGTCELLAEDQPPGVIISEAVELAASLSTDASAQFINGVLASLAKELRNFDAPVGRAEPPAPPPAPPGVATSPSAYRAEHSLKQDPAEEDPGGTLGAVPGA